MTLIGTHPDAILNAALCALLMRAENTAREASEARASAIEVEQKALKMVADLRKLVEQTVHGRRHGDHLESAMPLPLVRPSK